MATQKERRLLLHSLLKKVPGVVEAYFQPPASVKMKYPCVLYKKEKMDEKYADNLAYFSKQRYTLTVITKDPDSEIPEELRMKFPLISIDRNYTASNLNHTVMTLYF